MGLQNDPMWNSQTKYRIKIMTMMNFCNRIVKEIVIQQKQENIHEYKVNMKMEMYLCWQFFRTQNTEKNFSKL